MLEAIRPFLRLLVLALFLFCAGYLSYFTPRHLLAGDGFTDDLWLSLITMGITSGVLYFTRTKPEGPDFYTGEESGGPDQDSQS